MTKNLKITVFGDSIGKGIVTDSGKIEIIKDCAVGLFEGGYGVKVDKKRLDAEDIKTFGTYTVNVKFNHGVKASFYVQVCE